MSRIENIKEYSLNLAGRVLREGRRSPDFRVVFQDLSEATLSDFEGKIKVITSFPSLDIPACDLQIKEFNQRASELPPEVVALGISKDLPFSQKKFCQANDIKNVIILSDYKYSSFGINYGLLIKELNLLARSVIILDKNNVVRYVQITNELIALPNYEDALKKLEEVINNPEISVTDDLPSKCKPCEGGVAALPYEAIENLIDKHQNWQLLENKKISREFKFKGFPEAKYFLDLISVIAEEQGHHPTMTLTYNKVKITLTTHSAGGLTENDFIMATMIDELEM